MLEVALSIVFILLVFSLFATTLMEIIASILSLRGRHLSRGLKRMLGSNGDTSEYQAFLNNPLYKQLKSKFLIYDRPPSYMSSKMFTSVLWNTLFKDEEFEGQKEEDIKANIKAKIAGVKDENLKQVLNQLVQEANFKVPDIKARLEEWYDEIMERVGGWYKRNTQAILIFVGLFIAVSFDADTINIFHELSKDTTTRKELVELVDTYSTSIASNDANVLSNSEFRTQIDAIIQDEINSINQRSQERLGLGWYPETKPKTFWEWFYKVLGWGVTALAISLGAPFWFGLLKKIMNLRSSGNVPQIIVPAATNQNVGSKPESSNTSTTSTNDDPVG